METNQRPQYQNYALPLDQTYNTLINFFLIYNVCGYIHECITKVTN